MEGNSMRDPENPVAGTRLPRDFVWGVSTSSYQIEGAAQDDGRRPSIWDLYSKVPGHVANGDTGDIACDHYHRYREDIGLMHRIGVGAYRFSVAWPRVLPDGRGISNEAGLGFYDRLIDGLLAVGIEPWLCLYHWDLPQALQEEGGWQNRAIVDWYAAYAALVAKRYGDRVRHFVTFNEPSVFSLFGYGLAWHPPGKKDPAALHQAIHHINLAHGAGVDAIRAEVPRALIGCIHNVQPARPLGSSPEDAAAARVLDAYWNRVFPEPQVLGHYPEPLAKLIEPYIQAGDLDRIRRPIDWFGVNHYSPIFARADVDAALGFAWADAPPTVRRSPIGWQLDPEAFRDLLVEVSRRYGLPVYVTENGAGANEAPDKSGQVLDHERISYLKAYIGALREAVGMGANVHGYFVWSLLDNFEWGAGYANRFGLVYVDYPTQRRIPKESAHWYARLINSEAMREVS
ncbi:beta-glucosidase [Enhydrobacter aerosaccus]|uniref:Beta-glucosidase n=1 Tax=Enhydrobacter aerosaccus TaxID=225324 RepID=A0A1T4R8R7_9HYPH|nr:GH1 family beta-glucosidase [Enhydrobacter aerosaccus]SKA12414.1 beta-glucosidase [Enhydrobacter aerosaccus]